MKAWQELFLFSLQTKAKEEQPPFQVLQQAASPEGCSRGRGNKEEYFRKNIAAFRITPEFESESDSKGKELQQKSSN